MFPTHPHRRALVAVTLFSILLAVPSILRAEESNVRLRAGMVPTPSQTCGLHSLYLCAKAGGYPFISIRELHQRAAPLDARGVQASDLVKWGREYGLEVEAVRADLAALHRWHLPAILHVNGNHYIVLTGWDKGRLVVFDNNYGLADCSPKWFQEHYRWDGIALVVGHPPPFWMDAASRYWFLLPLGAAGGFFVLVAQRLRRRRCLEPKPIRRDEETRIDCS